MNESRQTLSTNISQELDKWRTTINDFLGDVINDWSFDCQHKSDAELARSLKRIEQLRSELSRIIGAYADAVEADKTSIPNP